MAIMHPEAALNAKENTNKHKRFALKTRALTEKKFPFSRLANLATRASPFTQHRYSIRDSATPRTLANTVHDQAERG